MEPIEFPYVVSGAIDIFGLGACIAHIMLNFHPARLPLTKTKGRMIGLLQLFGFSHAANIVKMFTRDAPGARPTASEASHILENTVNKFINEANKPIKSKLAYANKKWMFCAAIEAGFATREYLVSQELKHYWRNAHIFAQYECEAVNIGAAGIMLGLVSLQRATHVSCFKRDIELGANWLASRSPLMEAHGLFTGNAGVALALAVVGRSFNRPDLVEKAKVWLATAATVKNDYDLFSGAAGVLWAGILIAAILQESWPLEMVSELGIYIMEGIQDSTQILAWPSSLLFDERQTPFFGAAHGSAGIAMVLAKWGNIAGDENAKNLAFRVFNSLYRNACSEDGVSLFESANKTVRPLSHWCHGTAGYLWSLLQAFQDAPEVREIVDWAFTAMFEKTVPLDNPTYCHGLAGQLELWRMLSAIPRFHILAKERAQAVAAALRLLHTSQNGLTIWHSEDPFNFTPDLWIGFLAPATALAMFGAHASEPLLSEPWLVACAQIC